MALTAAWEAVAADDGRTYYWNSETDEVTWEVPEGLVLAAAAQDEAPGSVVEAHDDSEAAEAAPAAMAEEEEEETVERPAAVSAAFAKSEGHHARRKSVAFSYSSAAGPTALDDALSRPPPATVGGFGSPTKNMRCLSTLWAQIEASQRHADSLQQTLQQSLLDRCILAGLMRHLGTAFAQWRLVLVAQTAVAVGAPEAPQPLRTALSIHWSYLEAAGAEVAGAEVAVADEEAADEETALRALAGHSRGAAAGGTDAVIDGAAAGAGGAVAAAAGGAMGDASAAGEAIGAISLLQGLLGHDCVGQLLERGRRLDCTIARSAALLERSEAALHAERRRRRRREKDFLEQAERCVEAERTLELERRRMSAAMKWHATWRLKRERRLWERERWCAQHGADDRVGTESGGGGASWLTDESVSRLRLLEKARQEARSALQAESLAATEAAPGGGDEVLTPRYHAALLAVMHLEQAEELLEEPTPTPPQPLAQLRSAPTAAAATEQAADGIVVGTEAAGGLPATTPAITPAATLAARPEPFSAADANPQGLKQSRAQLELAVACTAAAGAAAVGTVAAGAVAEDEAPVGMFGAPSEPPARPLTLIAHRSQTQLVAPKAVGAAASDVAASGAASGAVPASPNVASAEVPLASLHLPSLGTPSGAGTAPLPSGAATDTARPRLDRQRSSGLERAAADPEERHGPRRSKSLKSFRGLEAAYHSQQGEIERLSALLAEHASSLVHAKLELAEAAFTSEASQAKEKPHYALSSPSATSERSATGGGGDGDGHDGNGQESPAYDI